MRRNYGSGWAVAFAATLILITGCGGATQSDTPSESSKADGAPTTGSPKTSAPAAKDAKVKDSSHVDAASPWDAIGKANPPKDTSQNVSPTAGQNVVSADPPPITAPPGKELKKAAVGMGDKGRGYGTGILVTPVFTYWNVKERLALDLIKHAMDLYKAGSVDGKGPKTQNEFMKTIIKDNDIRLPTLPEGHRYVYDPAKEELFVEQPKEP